LTGNKEEKKKKRRIAVYFSTTFPPPFTPYYYMAHNISRKGCFKCGNRASGHSISISFLFVPSFPFLYTYVLLSLLTITIVGHIAENCTSQERLCYNCRKPGHESSACAEPRSFAAKQCYSCGGVGHIQAECPTLRLQGSNQKCYVRTCARAREEKKRKC
jgi:hypothetical protein